MVHPTIIDQPVMYFGREIAGDLAAATRREWLVTNGLGGFASGTVAGMPTRRYHGLFVTALSPPVERQMVVAGWLDRVKYLGQTYDLATFRFADGTIDPHGYTYIQSFALQGTVPTWTFALGDALIEKMIWMVAGEPTTYVRYRVVRASAPVHISVQPLVTARDMHALGPGDPAWQPTATLAGRAAVISMPPGIPDLHLRSDNGAVWSLPDRYRSVWHAEEAARGMDTTEDLWMVVGHDSDWLAPGRASTLVLTTQGDHMVDGAGALEAERSRQRALLRHAQAEAADGLTQHLVLAADQCIVAREFGNGTHGTTVIAGYHWFNDWGRDTMIALPGLTLATGRPTDGVAILRTFAHYVQDGLLPNNFPDRAGAIPGYNTADATLWYIIALWHIVRATHDNQLVQDLWPVIRDIIGHHQQGTRYGIGVDSADGLLRQGEPGLQLTWMDAKIDDHVVTPRMGKAVEINALWYNVLRIAAILCQPLDGAEAARLTTLAEQVGASFHTRFIPTGGFTATASHLADVVDSPGGDDWSLRPNQIFAVSLPFPLLEGAAAAAVVTSTGRALLTSYGLRSLAPDDSHYSASYSGDRVARDLVYHQGTVWSWLIGAYAEALWRVTGDPATARAVLAPFADHLADAGLGAISEIFDGGPPHTPRGAIAQAWGIAEVLRVWRLVQG